MFKELKEDMNKCLNEDCRNTQLNEIMRTIQDINIEIKKEINSPKESQTKVKLKKKFRKSSKSSEKSLANRSVQVGRECQVLKIRYMKWITPDVAENIKLKKKNLKHKTCRSSGIL